MKKHDWKGTLQLAGLLLLLFSLVVGGYSLGKNDTSSHPTPTATSNTTRNTTFTVTPSQTYYILPFTANNTIGLDTTQNSTFRQVGNKWVREDLVDSYIASLQQQPQEVIKEVINEVPVYITIEKPVEKIVEKIIEVPKGWRLKDSISPFPGYSEEFDCDDAAIYSYIYLTSLGYKVAFMYGNLDLTGETYSQSDHYWVMVTDNGTQYPYDLGFYLPDPQHFEGREVSYREALRWAWQDQVK